MTGKCVCLQMFAVVSDKGELVGPPCDDRDLAIVLYYKGVGWSGSHEALLKKWRNRPNKKLRIIRPVSVSFSIPARYLS